MQKKSNAALAWKMMMVASLFFSVTTMGQDKKFDLKTDYEHFWVDYTVTLKKINAEKNNQLAAAMVDQMKLEMLPRLKQLTEATNLWKKNQSAAAVQQMENWINSNVHAMEVADLQSDLMLRASQAGGELGKSFTAYMRGMTAPQKSR